MTPQSSDVLFNVEASEPDERKACENFASEVLMVLGGAKFIALGISEITSSSRGLDFRLPRRHKHSIATRCRIRRVYRGFMQGWLEVVSYYQPSGRPPVAVLRIVVEGIDLLADAVKRTTGLTAPVD